MLLMALKLRMKRLGPWPHSNSCPTRYPSAAGMERGGGDRGEAEKERADGESERRNQVTYPGDDQTDRRAGSRGRRAVPEHVDFRKETLGSRQTIRHY